MNNVIYIYSLIDPRYNKVRYIGKTVNLKRRYEQHLYLFTGNNPRKERWIQGLKNEGLKPEMVVIEECNESNWMDSEKRWIAHYREICSDLTNIADGGEDSWNCTEARNWRVKEAAKRTGAEIKKCYVCGGLTISHMEICNHCLHEIDPDFENSDWYQFLSKNYRETEGKEKRRNKNFVKNA